MPLDWCLLIVDSPKVGFEDYDEDVEEVEVEKTPKRKVHGRTPTAFVPKKATDRADVGKLSLGRWETK